MIRVQIQAGSGTEAFAAIRSEWTRLFPQSDCSPFLSWEWMSTWYENFGDDRTPVILKAYQEGELIAILPMLRDATSFLGLRTYRLSLMGNGFGGADHLDIISCPDNRSIALSAISSFLQTGPSFDLAEFENLSVGSPIVDMLWAAGRSAGARLSRFDETEVAVCPQRGLSDGWSSVLAKSKRAENFKRRLKKLERQPDFEFRSVTARLEVPAAFERFLTLHQKRWDSSGGSELTGHPRLIAFHRMLVSRLAEAGLVRFDELWLGGECRSSIYGLDNGRTFYYYNSGYDLEFAAQSVGLVLLGLSVKHAIERGNTLYDFLRGDEAYKFEWADRTQKIVNVTLSRNTFPMIVRNGLENGSSGIRRLARSALPSVVAGSIGNWRRGWRRNYQLSRR